MIQQAQELYLSATDVANHLSCHHLTTLNLLLARGELPEPAWDNPHLKVLQARGLEHERAYVAGLRSRGLEIANLSSEPDYAAASATKAQMARGVPVIVQGRLATEGWQGRPDVLLRVEKPSKLGAWSYEVVDCKLARETKAETILQLCLYSELVSEVQGVDPEFLHVIRPGFSYEPESYKVSSFTAYFRVVKRSLVETVQEARAADATRPEFVSHCDICRWWRRCEAQWRDEDSIIFVAGSSRLQRKELSGREIVTLEQLANLELPIPFIPDRGSRAGYARIREQARIQLEGRTARQPRYELLPLDSEQGFFRLPAPSLGDIFFDIEGDPYAGDGGIEYLFGLITLSGDNQHQYDRRWALDRAAERTAFEGVIEAFMDRQARFPDMHIYHFGAYEPSAIKRLMMRYASKEEEVDRLLRGGVFVDLHSIVRKALIASVEQYSLKDLERFTNYLRVVPLTDANQARHAIEHALERGATSALGEQTKEAVRAYNEDDCRSTLALRDWLERLRSTEIERGAEIPRPALADADPTEEVKARQRRVMELFAALTRDLPAEPKDRNDEQAARWLLAHAIDWHHREEKVSWWEFFRLKELSDEEMHNDKAALAGLEWRQRLPRATPRERAPTDQYHYPPQECSIKVGDTLFLRDEQRFGEVVALDPRERTLAVKKPQKCDALHPSCVFTHSHYSHGEQSESIMRLAEWILARGMQAEDYGYRAARDLLLRNRPRLIATESLSQAEDETVLQRACRVGLSLDHSVLPIQGPPGAGKTYTGAHMIVELVRSGKRVGIVAVSHKVIRKLLEDTAKAAQEHRVRLCCAHRKDDCDRESQPVREIPSNGEALELLQRGQVNVLGATNFVWSRQDFMNSVDALFVDEAGQMSLANVLACSPAARSIVLLGDPQQLEQPQKGSHPEGSDVSALAHILDGKPTIEDTHGIFLPLTWRLHPSVCSFTSEMFYEGRLGSKPGLEKQQLVGSAHVQGAGLWFVPVEHERNQNHSLEEIDQVALLVESMRAPGSEWIDRHSVRHPLALEDILIVAPYNSQVDSILSRLPGARVGTVDRFQGQEASVVIYSLTTSSAEDAPRGMEFLYDLNPSHVATSRAFCACVIVGNPKLFELNATRPGRSSWLMRCAAMQS